MLASTIQFSNHHAPHVSNPPRREQAYSMWASNRTTTDVVGWRSGSPKAYPYHSRTGRIPSKPLISSTPASTTTTPTAGAHVAHTVQNMDCILRRKEVIQPHLPVRLPCYDLVPITSLTLDGSPQKVGPPASGATHFHDLTGGVYKARERIHRGVADPRLLATPPSWSRVADSNPN